MTTPTNNLPRARQVDSMTPLEYSEIADMDLRAFLQRREERILSYTRDMTDSLLAMAGEFRQAYDKLGGSNSPRSQWARWVARFHGISIDTANRLARLGELEQTELEGLRSGLFARSGGIAGIAAYLTAPAEVQEQVQSGEVPAQQKAIQEAVRAFKEAQEAQQRAEEAEQRARQAEANVEARVQEARNDALVQGQLELQRATAQLQRELDEAHHQSLMRQRDIEDAQREIQQAQAAYQQRVNEATTKATTAERERLERDYTARMRDLQKQLDDQRKAANVAKKQVDELNERLTRSRDSETVQARWDALSALMVDTLDKWLSQLPSAIDAQYFEAYQRTMADSVQKRSETLARRMGELTRGSMSVVDAG